MAKNGRLTRKRFETIVARQHSPKFGKDYQPSIRATREEAPADSSPAEVWSERLKRYVATLSEPERRVLSVALYCPWLFDLHEQRMLPYLPSAHPLSGHPVAAGLVLPATRGTVEVANELGYLRYHPIVAADGSDNHETDEGQSPEPGCWIGDFLLFLKDPIGPYCVNLNIKQTRSEFSEPSVGVTPKTDMVRARLSRLLKNCSDGCRAMQIDYRKQARDAEPTNAPQVACRLKTPTDRSTASLRGPEIGSSTAC